MDQEFLPQHIINDLEASLATVTETKVMPFNLSSIFTLFFMQFFWYKWPILSNTILNQSNWTYHTAFSIKRATEALGLDCVYETMGRLDAVIQLPGEPPQTILYAEWEARYQSVFGEGKELDKLWQGASQNQGANALLITYCPLEEYGPFLRDITEYWQNKDKRRKKRPVLFVVTILYQVNKNLHAFHTISGTEIHKEGVKIWGSFDENKAIY